MAKAFLVGTKVYSKYTLAKKRAQTMANAEGRVWGIEYFDYLSAAKSKAKYGVGEGYQMEWVKPNLRNPESTAQDWIPVHAIRKTPDGGIQILTERGVMSNPKRRKGYLAKVRGLFTKGARGVRRAIGNPTTVKYHKIPEGWLAIIYTPNGIVKGIGDTKLKAAMDARKMIHK